MKGDIAMKKLDLISDEYIREAEIPEEHDIIVVEKSSFWQKLSNFMNSPLGVAMLCAVVSLSVLAAIVMAGTSKWAGGVQPAGSQQESESSEINHERIPPLPEGTEFKVQRTKEHVSEFYQALIDQGMMGMVPPWDNAGELVTTDDPSYFFDEEDIYNVTPTDVYEQTGAMIFDTGWLIYLWHNDQIHIMSTRVALGTSFFSAVPCDYDLNGIPDVLYTYAFHMSGVWGYTAIGVYDTVAHQVIPAEGDSGLYVTHDAPAVLYEMSLEPHSAPTYLVYSAEESSASDTERVFKPVKLTYILHPSEQGLMLTLQDSEQILVVPVPDINHIDEFVPTVLSQYFDQYGFVGGLSEGDFVNNVLGKFSYEGQALNEFPFLVGDGELGGGGYVTVANFYESYLSFEHYVEHHPTGENLYSYTLRTQVPLEGLMLPYDIALGDPFDQVMTQMSLDHSPVVTPGATVLYRMEGETLTLIWEDIEAAFSYRLVFEETQTSNLSEDRSMAVTRKLTLSFGQDLKLYEVNIKVNTQYSVHTAPSPDMSTMTPAVQAELKEAFIEQNLPAADQEFYSTDDLSIRYFGTYNGGFVVFMDGIFDYTTAEEHETVLGIEFVYGSGQKLLYYRDGRFYSLPDAAGAGLLSQADVENLYSVYTN